MAGYLSQPLGGATRPLAGQGASGHNPQRFLRIGKEWAQLRQGLRSAQAAQAPQGQDPACDAIGALTAKSGQFCQGTRLYQGLHGPVAHHGTGVGQPPRAGDLPDFQPPWVGKWLQARPGDAVDGAQRLVLHHLRRWAAEFVPAACVNHQDGTIGVFQHIGGVEIGVVGHQQVGGGSLQCRARRAGGVRLHPPQVELAGE